MRLVLRKDHPELGLQKGAELRMLGKTGDTFTLALPGGGEVNLDRSEVTPAIGASLAASFDKPQDQREKYRQMAYRGGYQRRTKKE